MNDDLISRKSLIENLNKFAPEHYNTLINDLIAKEPTAFDKEKVIEELKTWEKVLYNAGVQSKYAGLHNRASEYYQESWAYHKAISIVEKGGLE